MTKELLKARLTAVQGSSTLQLTTLGRKTGKRHTVTVWFLVDRQTLYLVTMKLRRDWPRNLIKNGHVELGIGGKEFTGHAKPVVGAKRLAQVNALLQRKYWAAWLGSWVGMGPEGAFAVTIEA